MMMLSGLCRRMVNGMKTKRRAQMENSIRVRMHHQLFHFSLLNSISSYLLYVDSSKVPSPSPRIKPDQPLRPTPDLMMSVLVLQLVKQKTGGRWAKGLNYLGNYDWNINGRTRGLTREWLDYRTHFSQLFRRSDMTFVRFFLSSPRLI